MTATRPIAAASLALLALLFTGCAAGTADTGSSDGAKTEASAEAETTADQSTQEACDLMKGSLEELVTLTSGENAGALATDPSAAVAALKTAEASMREAAADVTNDEIAAPATAASAAMTEYVAFLDTVVADPANADMAKLGDQVTALQSGITGLSEVCTL